MLRAAEADGIDVFVTGDATMVHEQNLTARRLAIVVLLTNNWPLIKTQAARILRAIDQAEAGSFQVVECGRFSRQR